MLVDWSGSLPRETSAGVAKGVLTLSLTQPKEVQLTATKMTQGEQGEQRKE